MRIAGVESTDLFVGTTQRPLQVVRVTLDNDGPDTAATVHVDGPGVRNAGPFGINDLSPGEQRLAEVPVEETLGWPVRATLEAWPGTAYFTADGTAEPTVDYLRAGDF